MDYQASSGGSARLIKSGKKRVTEACFDVGFKNLSHFSKIYKEAYGVAPSW
jgi:AraC-like DNA-binding protein